jgi:hypothetical protein
MPKTDALLVDPKTVVHRIIADGIEILTEPHWYGDVNASGFRLYRCLANVYGALCVIEVTLTEG